MTPTTEQQAEMDDLDIITETNQGRTWYVVQDYRTGYADPARAIEVQRRWLR